MLIDEVEVSFSVINIYIVTHASLRQQQRGALRDNTKEVRTLINSIGFLSKAFTDFCRLNTLGNPL